MECSRRCWRRKALPESSRSGLTMWPLPETRCGFSGTVGGDAEPARQPNLLWAHIGVAGVDNYGRFAKQALDEGFIRLNHGARRSQAVHARRRRVRSGNTDRVYFSRSIAAKQKSSLILIISASTSLRTVT